MQKLQDSVFSIVKTTNLSPAVFSYLQPTEELTDKTPQGGILSDTKHGWLALGPKFCVVDLRSGLKVAARTFGTALSNFRTTVTSVIELPTPLTDNSQQLIISLECEDIAGMICVFHINGSQILRCIQTEVVVTELAVCDAMPDGPFKCFDGVIMAGTTSGEIIVFDLNRASLLQALNDILQGYEQMIRSEINAANLTFLPLNAVQHIETRRELILENEDHIAVLLNENSLVEGQYIFRNPDGSVRMKAKRDHIKVTAVQYIPQLGSLAVGFNFGAFQMWNIMNLELEFTSQFNVECLPVTHFGFQEPCDDPRAFCYLWVVFSVIDRFDEEEYPLAVMYSLTYQGKRMISDTKCLYQDFLTATIRFQVVLSTTEENSQLIGGRCLSCHSYSVNSTLGGGGEDSMLNICQLVWECWGENANSSSQYGMLLFDLDQWYKDQMPATYQLMSNAFMSATCCTELARGECVTLDVRLSPTSVRSYAAATRLEEHFYPNSLHYDCVCLNTSEALVLSTIGIQRQIINSMDEIGPTALLNPTRLYNACVATGLSPLYLDSSRAVSQEEQRRYLLSVALEARLSRFLQRCAHDWATGSHGGAGCTLPFLVDWCWKRAIELKENAKDLTAPLFTSTALPDRNVVRCLEHCVHQLTQLTGLLDAVLTKCCNLVVPDALSEMEENYKGIGTVSLYFQVVQWFLRCGLLPERSDSCNALPYPGLHLANIYSKRRLKLHRLQDRLQADENAAKKSCPLLYIDQLIEQEFGGDRIHQMWTRGGSECHGLYPPPSLYSLLRLYLLPDIPEEHKHSLVLYLLVDYSMVYDEIRYETVIRRLMQFPTMFGLSNTAIKATQAFWHLDHRDFDFALDQLQCLTGNNLSEWQHNVVLSSLLAQKKTQAALQYLHVRKPPPIQNICKDDMNRSNNRVNDHDKLEDWQSCCNLYLARGLVFEALDVIRVCVQNAGCLEDKTQVLNLFYKGCRNTGQLSKILEVTLLPFEEEVFIRYLENCNESQTSNILIMYLLQQARYLEAEQYNSKLKHSKPRTKDLSTSLESLADVMDREIARDTLVEVACFSLPAIANTVARCAFERNVDTHIFAPKPMSVYVQAKSPKNTFTYKSSFIQDTIENASETWVNKPKTRRGLKRALNIEETPFICTPKQARIVSTFGTDQISESTPPKRPRLDLSGTPRTPKQGSAYKAKLSRQMEALLDMPEVHSFDDKMYERSGADTPHSILKIRRMQAVDRETASPVDSHYLEESSDEEMMETASIHTHYSDSTNKHLRFTIPTASSSGSTPSPTTVETASHPTLSETERKQSVAGKEKDMDMLMESYVTTESHAMTEAHPLESPPKRMATEDSVQGRKTYKDSVRARLSLSISANSSLSEDLESISDIPITLINPRYSGERRRSYAERETEMEDTDHTRGGQTEAESMPVVTPIDVPKTPKARRPIRSVRRESTPLISRSRSVTPERRDSPVATPLRTSRLSRSRSRTPEISPRSSPLDPILEQPKQEVESELHALRSTLSAPRQLRSRSCTPEWIGKGKDSPRLEAITESPTKSDSPTSSPSRRSLRSRSRTPVSIGKGKESPRLEAITESPAMSDSPISSPSRRSLRSRSCTPESTGKGKDSPCLEAITESPTKSDSPISSPSRRSLRSRSCTPESIGKGKDSPRLEAITESKSDSPTSSPSRRSLRSRSCTPESIGKGKDSRLEAITDSKSDSPTSSPSRRSLRSRSCTLESIGKGKDSRLEAITDSKTDSPTSSPSRRSLRSRSCTPESIGKGKDSRLEAITDSKSDSPTSSPSRRSLRSRSRTPEVEITEQSSSQPSLRTRAKTPEKLMSPKKESKSARKPLSRIVLEANAVKTIYKFDKTIAESDNTEKLESVMECTPMKTLKVIPNLMDVTISPIVGKSVLQSSDDSLLSESDVKETKVPEDSAMDVGLKSPPAFTMDETRFGKSILNSYESSIAETSLTQEDNKEKAEGVSKVDLKSLPAVTLSETYFEKSVLHSYQSSVAETSATDTENVIDEVKETYGLQLKSSQGSTTLNITGLEKSVLGSCESSMAHSSPISTANKDMKTKEQEASASTSVLRDVSSIMTSDSEMETREDAEHQWKEKDRPDTASIIQKEKEKINEIQREINELEGDMSGSDPDEDEHDSDDGEEEEEEGEDMSVGTDEESESCEGNECEGDFVSTDEALPSDESEVISIHDSESDSNSEDLDTYAMIKMQTVKIQTEEKVTEVNVEGEGTYGQEVKNDMATDGSHDPLNEARISLLTDDNSMMDLDYSHLNLNYSNEMETDEVKVRGDDAVKEGDTEKVPVETEVQPQVVPVGIDIAANYIAKQILMDTDESPTDDAKPTEKSSAQKAIDAVDATTVKEASKVDETTIEQETKDKSAGRSKTSEIEERTEGNEKPKKVDKPAHPRKRATSTSSKKLSKDDDDAKPTEKSSVQKAIDVVKAKTVKEASKVDETTIEQETKDKSAGRSKTSEIEDRAEFNENPMEVDKPAHPRKRATSTSSKKSSYDDDDAKPTEKSSAQKTIDVVDATTVKEASKVDETTIEQETKDKSAGRSNTSEIEERTEVNEKPMEVDKPAHPRKRATSTSSKKSTKEKDVEVEKYEEKLKTPVMRKRSQSTKSNTSTDIEQNTLEKAEVDMSSSIRSKTPTREDRIILTRRASKKLSEKLNDSLASLDELTPKRRSTRSSSRNIDDNASVASGNSVKSVKSKPSEEAGDKKLPRKGRKSVLATKPDLSVIPEHAAEESGATSNILKEYFSDRRLTRKQEAKVKAWLEPESSPRGRRPSTASLASSQQPDEDDDASSSNSAAFDVQPIDRISLLNKGDFEGSPDSSEMQIDSVSPDSLSSDTRKQRRPRVQRAVSEPKPTPRSARASRRISVGLPDYSEIQSDSVSPDSISSEASKQRQPRVQRAVSEPKPTPRSARASRRISVDIGETSARGSPVAGAVGSTSDGRRASFTRACEALTPKRRRASTVQRN